MFRSTAVGFFQTVEMSSTFVLTKMKPILMEALDIHGMFAMFASKIFISKRNNRPHLIIFSECIQCHNSYSLLYTEKQNNVKFKFD